MQTTKIDLTLDSNGQAISSTESFETPLHIEEWSLVADVYELEVKRGIRNPVINGFRSTGMESVTEELNIDFHDHTQLSDGSGYIRTDATSYGSAIPLGDGSEYIKPDATSYGSATPLSNGSEYISKHEVALSESDCPATIVLRDQHAEVLQDQHAKVFVEQHVIPTPEVTVISDPMEIPVGLQSLIPNPNLPLDRAGIVMAHNAYNSPRTGLTSIIPNQRLPIPKLLSVGVRAFELDVYFREGKYVLCHGMCNQDLGRNLGGLADKFFGANRQFIDVLKEFRDFIAANPEQGLYVKVEDHVGSHALELSHLIQDVVGNSTTFTADDLYSSGTRRWPSFREMVEAGKHFMFATEHLTSQDEANHFFVNTEHCQDQLLLPQNVRATCNPGLGQYYSAHETELLGFHSTDSCVSDPLLSCELVSPGIEEYTRPPYYSVTESESRALEIFDQHRAAGRLVEFGEDGAFTSSLRRTMGFFNGNTGGGQFTTRQTQILLKRGGLVGMDHIEENDPRVLSGVSGFSMLIKENSYYSAPIAITASITLLGLRQVAPSAVSSVTGMVINSAIYKFLPVSPMGTMLYEASNGAITEISRQYQSPTSALNNGTIDGTATGAIVGYTQVVTQVVWRGFGQAMDKTIKYEIGLILNDFRNMNGLYPSVFIPPFYGSAVIGFCADFSMLALQQVGVNATVDAAKRVGTYCIYNPIASVTHFSCRYILDISGRSTQAAIGVVVATAGTVTNIATTTTHVVTGATARAAQAMTGVAATATHAVTGTTVNVAYAVTRAASSVCRYALTEGIRFTILGARAGSHRVEELGRRVASSVLPII